MQRWDTGHPTLRFISEDPDFECVYVGQTGKVWRVNEDKSIYVELHCGHPYTLQPEDLGTLAEPADQASHAALIAALNKENEPMATKAPKVASSKGVIPVQGHEAKVKEFKTDLNFFKQLEARVDEGKTFFRTLAEQVRVGAEGVVKRIEFLSDDGSATVPVTIPDISKDGNRTVVKDGVVSKVAQLGLALDELGVTKTEYTYVLTGEFVAWLDEILTANYTSKGQEVPAGIEKKATMRLTVEGVEKLRKMMAEAKTDNEREAARLLLEGGIKAAGVSAK
jgi:hypothetical protein